MTDMNKTELLAPAGSYEAFEAALGAGADAVYVGGPDFGARAYAKNFTQEELIRAVRTAHLHGKKLYLTVNTLLKNRELKERLYDSLLPSYLEGLDAVIVQDMGVLQLYQEKLSGSVHSCKYADGCYRTEGNAVSGTAGSNPCGSCP